MEPIIHPLIVFHDEKNLPIFHSIEDIINPDQISNSICKNAAPKLQGTSTILHCFLETLITVWMSLWQANCLLLQPNISNSDLVTMLEVQLFDCNSSMKTTSGQTSPDSRWWKLGPTGSWLCWADGTPGWHLILKGNKVDMIFIKVPWLTTASMILNDACFLFVLLKKSLRGIPWNPSLL